MLSREALHSDLVPYQTAFLVAARDASTDLLELRELLVLLAEEKGIVVDKSAGEARDAYERADSLGIPFLGERRESPAD